MFLRTRPIPLMAVLLTALTFGCGSSPESPTPPEADSPPVVPDPALPLVVFLGDSITAGYQLPEDQAFPALLERELRERDRPVRVINAGVSGDTSAGGLARLDWILSQAPDVVVIELGANDGLRGLPVEETGRNLRKLVERSRASGAAVLVLAMQIPPSYGQDYAEGFRRVYPQLARDTGVPLVTGFLEGVGGVRSLNLPDGLHPNAAGHRVLADNVLPDLTTILDNL